MANVLRSNVKAADSLISAMQRLDKTGDNTDIANAWRDARKEIDYANAELSEMNNDLKRVNQTQQQTHNGFKGWRATFAGIAGSIYTIKAAFSAAGSVTNIVDEYTLTTAKLNLINDGLQTTAQLQNNIFKAAQASRGSYSDMAASVSKLGLLAGDAFNGNAETTKFAELMQKSFVLGGASTQEQQSGMYQLTQAMAAGKLQGDEFRSIMENAPLLAQAIADFTGKSKGELKEMSAEGVITADVIKGALFSASDDINSQFETLPRTFGSVMQSMKNQMLMGSQGIVQQLGQIADSAQFQTFANGLVTAATKVVGALGWIINHARGVGIALSLVISLWASFKIATTIAAVTMTLFSGAAQLGFVRTTGLAASLVGYTGTSLSAAGGTTTLTGAVTALNGAMAMNPIGAVVFALSTLIGLLSTAAIAYKTTAEATNAATSANLAYFESLGIIGGLPQDEKISQLDSYLQDRLANTSSGIAAGRRASQQSAADNLQSQIDALENAKNSMVDWLQNSSDDALGSLLSYLQGKSSTSPIDLADWGLTEDDKSELTKIVKAAQLQRTMDNFNLDDFDIPDIGTVDEVNKINSDIDISDESLKYLVDGVTRQYVNNINLQTVQPNINVEFTGNIGSPEDLDGVAERLLADMQEKMFASTDLAY